MPVNRRLGELRATPGMLGWCRRRHATADRRVVHHQAAGAARDAHRVQAITARLNHVAAFLVAGSAGQHATVVGRFAGPHAHGEAAAAYIHAIHHAANRAHAVLHHHAEVLHHAACNLVVAHTVNLHSARTLLETHGAARHHHVVRPDRHRCWHAARGSHARHAHVRHVHAGAIHHHRARHEFLRRFRCTGEPVHGSIRQLRADYRQVKWMVATIMLKIQVIAPFF